MIKYFKVSAFVLIIIFISSNIVTNAIEFEKRRKTPFIKPEDVAKERSLYEAVERARLVLYIIDDLYKLYLTITAEKYVNDMETISSVAITKKVFNMMERKGWHKARFLSVSPLPLNPNASPKDDFERKAVKEIISGKKYYERFYFDVEGNNYLRGATEVHFTTKKCLVCHPGKKVGDLMGLISYTFPLEKYLLK